MTQLLKRFANLFICSGIITGSSYLTVLYLEHELKNIFAEGITKAIHTSSNTKKFEILSEKLLKRMIADPRNTFKLSEALVKIIKKKKFKRHSALSISKPFNDQEIVHYLRLFIEINYYAYLRNYNIRQEDQLIFNE